MDTKCWLLGKGATFLKCTAAGSFGTELIALDIAIKDLLYMSQVRGKSGLGWCKELLEYTLEPEANIIRMNTDL